MKRILRDETFMQEPEKDRISYLSSLCDHFAAEMNRVANFVDRVIICKDSRSWRKDAEVVQQIDLETGLPKQQEDYKANRKLSEDRNWSEIFATFNEFCECLRTNFHIPVVQVNGAEGDDCIYVSSRWTSKHGRKSAIYCTDSDLNQLVNEDTLVLRRIKSKAAPEGEIVIDKNLYNLIYKQSSNPFESMMFDVTAIQSELDIIGNKTLESGVVPIMSVHYQVLKQMICGSGKDNVPELFSWKAKTINRHLSPKNHIEPALKIMGLYPEDIEESHLYDEAFLKSLICNIVSLTKQTEYFNHIEHLYRMAVSNRKLNYLNGKEIPKQVVSDILHSLSGQKDLDFSLQPLLQSQTIKESLGIDTDKVFASSNIYQ